MEKSEGLLPERKDLLTTRDDPVGSPGFHEAAGHFVEAGLEFDGRHRVTRDEVGRLRQVGIVAEALDRAQRIIEKNSVGHPSVFDHGEDDLRRSDLQE